MGFWPGVKIQIATLHHMAKQIKQSNKFKLFDKLDCQEKSSPVFHHGFNNSWPSTSTRPLALILKYRYILDKKWLISLISLTVFKARIFKYISGRKNIMPGVDGPHIWKYLFAFIHPTTNSASKCLYGVFAIIKI